MVRELGALFGREKSQPTNVDSKIKSFIVIKFLLSYAEQHDSLCQFSSVAQSCPTLRPYGLQHIRPLCPSPIPGAYSNSCPLSWQYHPTISSSVTLFSFCLQSAPASGSFPMSQVFASGGQSIGASASVFPMNVQGWFPLGLVWSPCSPRDSEESSPTPQFRSILGQKLSLYLSLISLFVK